ALPADVCHHHLDAYSEYLKERDGKLDVQRRTLARREASMARFESAPRRVREMDRPLFSAQYKRFDPTQKTTPDMMLLLSLTKINAAEAYGVGAAYGKALERALANDDQLEVNLLIEE